MTALQCVTDKGFEDFEVVKILVEQGSNINLQDKVFFFFLSFILFHLFSHFLILGGDGGGRFVFGFLYLNFIVYDGRV